jgi:predicted TIM-barrel fold metal-dependent hydrolase
MCPNIHLDTSSSNRWIKYFAGLTLEAVFRHAVQVLGPERLLFGTDSSFFPRGWQRPIFDTQIEALDRLNLNARDVDLILGGNFDRLFPLITAQA